VPSGTLPREALKSEAAPQAGAGNHAQCDLLRRPHDVGSQGHDALRRSEQGKHGRQELQ